MNRAISNGGNLDTTQLKTVIKTPCEPQTLLASELAKAGYKPKEIEIVVLTNLHPDHIGGSMENGKPQLPNARYVTGEMEYDFWLAKAAAKS